MPLKSAPCAGFHVTNQMIRFCHMRCKADCRNVLELVLLFIRSSRGLLQMFSRQQMVFNLIKKQTCVDKNTDAPILPTGSTVAVQRWEVLDS